ncbi:MAG: PAS domain S-box protein [Rhodopirellula sp.]|nr:PAS domain S-box protein [Rhodopirellula sp.]
MENIKAVGPLLCPSAYCYAVHQDHTDLASALAEGLAILKQTGKYQQLRDKWLGIYETQPVPWRLFLKVAAGVLAPVVLLIVILLAWSRTLRREVERKTADYRWELDQRRQVESGLQQAEQRYRSLIDTLPSGVAECNLHGTIVFTSPSHTRMLDREPEEIIGTKLWDWIADEPSRARLQTVFEHVVRNRPEPFPYVFPVQRADGRVMLQQLDWNYKIDSDGNLIGFVTVVSDITERQAMERALRESKDQMLLRNRIAQVFLSSGDDTLYADALAVVLDVFSADFGFFGYVNEQGDFTSASMTHGVWEKCRIADKTIIFPRSHWTGLWGRSLLEKRSLFQNGELEVPEGHVRLHNCLVAPILFGGELIGQFGVANAPRDFCELDVAMLEMVADYVAPVLRSRLENQRLERARSRAEQALRHSEELYRTLVDNVDIGIALIDRDHKVLMANHAIVNMRNGSPCGAVGDKCYRAFEGGTDACSHCPGARAMSQGSPAEAYRERVGSNGERVSLKLRALPIRDADGVPAGFIETVQDITDQLRAETELRQYTAALESANQALEEFSNAANAATKAKSEFLANMSHEIRTPMTAILGFADLLLESVDSPEATEAVTTIRRNGEYLLSLINGILDLSKIEAGKLHVERIGCSVVETVEEVEKLMRIPAQAKNLPLVVEYAGPMPRQIETDPVRLRQILINLVGNAVKFTEVGSVRLIVRFQPAGDHPAEMHFDVVDTGIGMTRANIDTLFRPFTQGDTSTSRKFGGSGLGLAISKRLAELLGGDVAVTSAPGKGSTFRLSIAAGRHGQLQCVDGGRTCAAENNAPANGATALPEGCRILLVEDGPDNQRLIAFLLKKAGAEVVVCENGKVAVDTVVEAVREGRRFDLVLMDMQMPVMDGYQATAVLRSMNYAGPIVALTAHAMKEDRQKGIRPF